jgi:thiol-disulfide isomerase/thioredoxin
MKKYMFVLACIAGIMNLYAQNGFTVKAKINNPENYTLFLGYTSNGKFVADTTYTVEDGWYVFKGIVDEPVVAHLGARKCPALTIKTEKSFIPGPSLNFYLSNEVIKVTGDVNTIYMSKVEGGQANKEWNKIKKREGEITHRMWLLNKKSAEVFKPANDTIALKKSQETRTALVRELEQLRHDFMVNNPWSIVSLYILSNMVNTLSFAELKTAYENLGPDHKHTAMAKRIADKIESMDATAVGKKALQFEKKELNGSTVSLKSLQGKYVLIDFWGSWCKPCRIGHPHMKELYAKYKEKGLEIVGVAQETGQDFTKNETAWKNAITQDGINWVQVLNNEVNATYDVVKMYGVSAFPTKVLLDKDGVVIARFVGDSEKLDEKLKEIFGY